MVTHRGPPPDSIRSIAAPVRDAPPWTLLFVHAGAFATTAVLAGYLAEHLRREGVVKRLAGVGSLNLCR